MNAPHHPRRPLTWATSRSLTMDALLTIRQIMEDAKYASCDDMATEAERETAHDLVVELTGTVETLTGTLERYRQEEIDRLHVAIPAGASEDAGDRIEAYNREIKEATPTVAQALADREMVEAEGFTYPVAGKLRGVWL